MGKVVAYIKQRARLFVQLLFTAASNSYIEGWVNGTLYRGGTKYVCLPGLNCYSCPGARGACPIGSLQAVLGDRDYKFSFYVTGFLLVVGAALGRLVCGWLCPFGLVQDLLHKIPVSKKRKTLPGDKVLKYLKYAVLIGFVITLPLFAVNSVGQGDPWFCKYICPSGTLMAGIPLVLSSGTLAAAAGWLFAWKYFILVALLVLSLFVFRPFCRYLCPLGAIYGLFNFVALYRLKVDTDKCTACGACHRVCPSNIVVYQKPNSPDCIRCGACIKTCPENAICSTIRCKSNRPSVQKDVQ